MVAESANAILSSSASSESVMKKTADNRRSNKPIMEKRRRARINNCLNQLKTLILDAMKKDPARHSKLEKADILEMTVKHLQNMQIAAAAGVVEPSPTMVAGKFRAGFTECASEVGRYPGLEAPVKRRLLQHLANCLNQQAVLTNLSPQQQQQQQQQPTSTTEKSSMILTPNGMQLVPTRLPNGDIALVLPNNATGGTAGVPILVPMPTRTSSTASAASSSSSASSTSSHYASSESPEPMDTLRYSPAMQKPLALVMRKSVNVDDEEDDEDDEKPWRPW